MAFWGISRASQSSSKYSLATSLEERQKVNNIEGVYSCGGHSCTPPGKLVYLSNLSWLHFEMDYKEALPQR